MLLAERNRVTTHEARDGAISGPFGRTRSRRGGQRLFVSVGTAQREIGLWRLSRRRDSAIKVILDELDDERFQRPAFAIGLFLKL